MLRIESTAFESGSPIPARYTCDGDDELPPLRFVVDVPGAQSLALIVDDPDAPDPRAPKRVWAHYLVYDLPPSTTALSAVLPDGAYAGRNDAGATSWRGPCPPIGRHRYFFKLYALDVMLPPLQKPDRAALLAAMQGHILEEAELMGTYQKHW